MARKEKKYHYIYKTTNLKNGKYYVGMHSTNNLNDGYLGSGKRLRRSLNKYGKENFKFEILEFLNDRVSLKEREKELVNEELLKDSLSMNLKIGGEGGMRGLPIETIRRIGKLGNEKLKNKLETDKEFNSYFRKRLSEGNRGRKLTEEHKKNISISAKKRVITEEHKIKISIKNSIKQTGNGNSQFGTCWITNGKESKKIHLGDLIPDGWKLGRKIK